MDDKINEIIELHEEISRRYKEFENITGESPPVVVLSELRYALRALIKLLQLGPCTEPASEEERSLSDKALQETLHGLRNAYHDMVDSILDALTQMLGTVSNDYPTATFNILEEKQIEILKDINEINSKIENSRGQGEDREKIYKEDIYRHWFVTIAEHYKYIDPSIIVIIREGERIKTEKQRSKRRYILSLTLAIFGIIVGIAGIIFSMG